VELVAHGHESAVDLDGAFGEVDVVPLQADELASAHPGRGEDPQGGEEPVTRGGSEEPVQLLGVPGLGFDLGDRSQSGGLCHERDVAVQEPVGPRVGQRAADDEVDFEDGLRRERSGAVGRAEHGLIQRLEVFGSEPSQRDTSEAGEDVPLDLAAVPVVGRWREVRSACPEASGG